MSTSPPLEAREEIALLPPELRGQAQNLPPTADPLRFKNAEVTHILERSAVFPCFSLPAKERPNVPLVAGRDLVGVEVHEDLHRFDVRVDPPQAGKGRQPVNRIGRRLAEIEVVWRPIGDGYVAAPGVEPPPTSFDPRRSQRFQMDHGRFTFLDRRRSGFTGFANGRTFPSLAGGEPRLRIGGIVDVREAFGAFAGLEGTVAVDGMIEGHSFLALSVLPLFVDLTGRFLTRSAPTPIREEAHHPDPDALFLTFVAQGGPGDPAPIIPADHEQVLAFAPSIPMRLAHLSCDLGGPQGLRSWRQVSQVVGTADSKFFLGPFGAAFPVALQSRDARLSFFDGGGRTIGTLAADIVEGRAFALDIPGLPVSALRGAGIAPIDHGTGIFENASGLVVINGLFSLFPRVTFVVYVLRLSDPDQQIRRAIMKAWK